MMAPYEPKVGLAMAAIVFYAPALLTSIYIAFHRSIRLQYSLGFIFVLCAMRLVGASMVLYIETQNYYMGPILEAAAMTSALSTCALLLALLGLVWVAEVSLTPGGISRYTAGFMKLATLLLVAATVLTAVGVDDILHTKSGSDHTKLRIGSIMYLVSFGILALGTHVSKRHSRLPLLEGNVIKAGYSALPFLLVRIAYPAFFAFAGPRNPFDLHNITVWGSIFIEFLTAVVVVKKLLKAGLKTPKKSTAADPSGDHESLLGSAEQQPQVQQPHEDSSEENVSPPPPPYQEHPHLVSCVPTASQPQPPPPRKHVEQQQPPSPSTNVQWISMPLSQHEHFQMKLTITGYSKPVQGHQPT